MYKNTKYHAVIDEVATFVRVVRQNSLAGAARELDVPKSTISRRIGRLEKVLDVMLVHKGARQFTLTTEGRHLFESVHSSIDRVEIAINTAVAGGSLPRGTIRVTAPPDFGNLLLLDELLSFGELWPDITFEVDFSSRYVDVIQEGYDLAIRAGQSSVQPGSDNLITRKLLESDHYIAGRLDGPPIKKLSDLKGQPFVLFGGAKHQQTLQFESKGGAKKALEVEGRFVVHDYTSMAKLVSMGAGYGVLPKLHLEHSEYALRCILPKFYVPIGHLWLVYPSRQLPRRVSLLVDHLISRCE